MSQIKTEEEQKEYNRIGIEYFDILLESSRPYKPTPFWKKCINVILKIFKLIGIFLSTFVIATLIGTFILLLFMILVSLDFNIGKQLQAMLLQDRAGEFYRFFIAFFSIGLSFIVLLLCSYHEFN